jgi:hypothetical protein
MATDSGRERTASVSRIIKAPNRHSWTRKRWSHGSRRQACKAASTRSTRERAEPIECPSWISVGPVAAGKT